MPVTDDAGTLISSIAFTLLAAASPALSATTRDPDSAHRGQALRARQHYVWSTSFASSALFFTDSIPILAAAFEL